MPQRTPGLCLLRDDPRFKPEFINEVCRTGNAPWFKTVALLAERLEKSPNAEFPPLDRWRLRPRVFLLLDLEEKCRLLTGADSRLSPVRFKGQEVRLTEKQFWRPLGLLALTRQRTGLMRQRFRELGLWQEEQTEPVLSFASNLVHFPGGGRAVCFPPPRTTPVSSTTAVGLFLSGNAACGAADLSGNVWEWCQTKWTGLDSKNACDAYNSSTSIDEDDGGANRVLRGGSWVYVDPGDLRAACRLYDPPGGRSSNCVFRVVVRVGGCR